MAEQHLLATALAVAGGGAVGALGRWGTAALVRAATSWPAWAGTMIVNLAGCFAIGVAYAWLESRDHPDWMRGILITGLLGAFTTFSTFSLDAMHLIHDRQWGQLTGYVGGSLVVGLIAAKVGMSLGTALVGAP